MKGTIWGLGFRPFFLIGSIVGGLLVTYWSIIFFNGTLPNGYFDPINWHAHEMIYGFAISIVSGFLLTASANWTGTTPLSGIKLKRLFFLWMAGRVAFILSIFELPIPPLLYFVVDVLFLPSLILALAPPLLKSKQYRNIQFLLVLSLLSLGNILMHFAAMNVIEFHLATRGIYLGVSLILLILVIISGRVIPFFTGNAIPGVNIKKFEVLDKAAIISVCIFILIDFFEQETNYAAKVALVASVLNFARWLSWKPWKTIKNPLLWILFLGYLWIVVGFMLVFLSDVFDVLPRSVAIHAFTAGAMGTFILGMMSRVSLGHTGRPLKLEKGVLLAYGTITLSGLIRVGSGFVPEWYAEGILLSGMFWTISFILFLYYYFSILTSPRADGKPG